MAAVEWGGSEGAAEGGERVTEQQAMQRQRRGVLSAATEHLIACSGGHMTSVD